MYRTATIMAARAIKTRQKEMTKSWYLHAWVYYRVSSEWKTFILDSESVSGDLELAESWKVTEARTEAELGGKVWQVGGSMPVGTHRSLWETCLRQFRSCQVVLGPLLQTSVSSGSMPPCLALLHRDRAPCLHPWLPVHDVFSQASFIFFFIK